MFHGLFFCLALLLTGSRALAEEPLTIAVASNFAAPAHELAQRFEAISGHAVRITAGSTGKLYAQISNGAPFDILLAADQERPALLEEAGLGIAGSRFTYASGSLVLWSRDPAFAGVDCRAALARLGSSRLAIANPQTAPYGVAARQFLQSEGLWEAVRRRLVYGENIAQTLQFVASGNAGLGLIANSQAIDERLPEATCLWRVPDEAHDAIEQQLVLLRRAESDVAAHDFLAFMRGPHGKEIITAYGYRVPQ